MGRSVLLTFVILMSAILAGAQAGGPGNVPGTLNGCLQREGFQYSLIDQAGKSHRLTGNTGKLNHLVGHQVEITGKPAIKTIDTTEQNIASSVEEIPVFQVKTAKLLGSSCTSPKQ